MKINDKQRERIRQLLAAKDRADKALEVYISAIYDAQGSGKKYQLDRETITFKEVKEGKDDGKKN